MAQARDRGVTLIELLVALAVAATLAVIAFPTYRAQVLRAHRFEAMSALLATAAAQERFHLAQGRYAAWLSGEGDGEPALSVPPITPGGRYRLELRDAGADRYRALARPLSGRGQDTDARCAVFEIESSGRRSARDAAGRESTLECWR
ncbi:MAG: prepilin-type N-terminal cleavage/methylation domain-containing protein [Steroidobacteraceae bacterium]|jgi:type IV pilus assembly protein PilE|nr:prepilin-type N-terminal cleavage/methylation domain-containing protein [Steroidobacteraceae bacterium]